VLCLGLFITAILTIFFSGYKIKNNELYFYVGLIKITLDIKKVLLIKELNKKRLFLVYKDGKFTAIIINQKEFSIFIKALKEINPKIIYESAENQD
jgi:tRNA U34 2-thiouridine synthase MnmA/TrmU